MNSSDSQFNIWNDLDLSFPLPCFFWVNVLFPIFIVFNWVNPSINGVLFRIAHIYFLLFPKRKPNQWNYTYQWITVLVIEFTFLQMTILHYLNNICVFLCASLRNTISPRFLYWVSLFCFFTYSDRILWCTKFDISDRVLKWTNLLWRWNEAFPHINGTDT